MGGDEGWQSRFTSNGYAGFLGGTIYGAVKSAWQYAPSTGPKPEISTSVILTETATLMGKNAIEFGFISVIYTFAAASAAGIRNKDDPYNYGIGGFAVGTYFGLRQGKPHAIITKGVALGVAGVATAYIARQATQRAMLDKH